MVPDSFENQSDKIVGSFGRTDAATAEGGRSLLDLSTQLDIYSGGVEEKFGWQLTHWPACSEASVSWIPSRSGKSYHVKPRLLDSNGLPEPLPEPHPPRQWWLNPENDSYPGQSARMLELIADWVICEELRRARDWQIANGRAASRSRRYFVANELRYMWVLTFANAVLERREVMALVSAFARRLRNVLGNSPLVYWYSPELHPGGHGWHVNLFLARYVDHALMASQWGHGFVWVTDFARANRGPKGEPLGLCRTDREGWRRAAQYGCKYAQKDWSPEHVGATNHRYEVAQGFTPDREVAWVNGKADAERIVTELASRQAASHLTTWDSEECADWGRPPARTWRW